MTRMPFDNMFFAMWDIAFSGKPCESLQEKIETWLNTNPAYFSGEEGMEWTLLMSYATGENKHLLNERPMETYEQNRNRFLERLKELLIKYKP